MKHPLFLFRFHICLVVRTLFPGRLDLSHVLTFSPWCFGLGCSEEFENPFSKTQWVGHFDTVQAPERKVSSNFHPALYPPTFDEDKTSKVLVLNSPPVFVV